MSLKKFAASLIVGSLIWNAAYAEAVLSPKVRSSIEINAEEILHHTNDLRGEITQGLNNERVLFELSKLGIEKSEVEMRLAGMSDQELQQVQQGVQRQAGGDVITISITTLLIIIIAVLLIR